MPPFSILYEDKDILVCEKPHGVPTQSKRIGSPDMVSLLKNHIAGQKPGTHDPYLAVIHRLDQPVRGILVFAKTPVAAKSLNRQLQSQGFGKYYRALVYGIPEKCEDTLEDYMVKDARTNTSRICTADTKDAKLARLHYRTLNTSENCTELEIQLDTGRHHQIRCQLAHIGCPILGDAKYHPNAQALPRRHICLCAFRLEFDHPTTHKHLRFEIEPAFV